LTLFPTVQYLKILITLFSLEPFTIWFRPTHYLGIKHSEHTSLQNNMHTFFLDIFCVTKDPTSLRDPFTLINPVYVKAISGNTECFLHDTNAEENPSDPALIDHYLNVTLLPHQILIFPKIILKNMDTENLESLRYYDDNELRYRKHKTHLLSFHCKSFPYA